MQYTSTTAEAVARPHGSRCGRQALTVTILDFPTLSCANVGLGPMRGGRIPKTQNPKIAKESSPVCPAVNRKIFWTMVVPPKSGRATERRLCLPDHSRPSLHSKEQGPQEQICHRVCGGVLPPRSFCPHLTPTSMAVQALSQHLPDGRQTALPAQVENAEIAKICRRFSDSPNPPPHQEVESVLVPLWVRPVRRPATACPHSVDLCLDSLPGNTPRASPPLTRTCNAGECEHLAPRCSIPPRFGGKIEERRGGIGARGPRSCSLRRRIPRRAPSPAPSASSPSRKPTTWRPIGPPSTMRCSATP